MCYSSYSNGTEVVDMIQCYPCEKEWNVQLLLENSRAIKCPFISYHLLTTKKIQQVLSNQDMLEWYYDETLSYVTDFAKTLHV